MSGLTVDQSLVAESDCHVMCCALPGSGKSHTMISLAYNLIQKDKTYKLLLITFTYAAAQELNERLDEKIKGRDRYRVKAATFDSVFGQQLRNGARSNKRTLVGGEQHNFIERAVRYSNVPIEFEEALDFIEQYGRMIKPSPINGDESGFGWQVYQAYTKLLKQNNAQDFNHIARSAYLGVQNGTIPPLDSTHILVDEFQDTSDMQYAWLRTHGEVGAKLVVVGDDDQSIYSWRGAVGYQNMVNFQEDFNAVGYILKRCFRCRPEILEAGKRLIENNADRVPKKMISMKDAGGIVKVKGYSTQEEEFKGMVSVIGGDNQEWAVLARTNRVLDEAEKELRAGNIPYKRLGSKSIWDDKIADIVLKLLWSLIRPNDKRFISEILGWLGEDEEVIQSVRQSLIKSTFAYYIPPTWLDWSCNTEKLHDNWAEWGSDINGKINIFNRVKAIGDFIIDARDLKGRQENLVGVIGDILCGLKTEGGFVERVEILAKNLAPSNKDDNEEKKQGVVTLASLHSSKGLQWKQVWIAGSNQGVCPSNKALDEISVGGVEEERRLFYVGITRAVDELYLSFNLKEKVTSSQARHPSQFLHEAFPEETSKILKKLNKKKEE